MSLSKSHHSHARKMFVRVVQFHTQKKNQLVSFRWVREDNGCQPTPTKLPKSQVNKEVQVTWRKIGWGLDKAIGQRRTIRILITTFACREFNNNGSQGFKTYFAHLRKQNILYSDSLWQRLINRTSYPRWAS